MLSLDTIFVPRWWKKFSEATERVFRSPENTRAKCSAGGFFAPLRVFSHTVVHNVDENILGPPERAGDGVVSPTPTPRSATSELGSNSPDFRILLVEWNPLSSERPGAATCCAGGGPGFCVDFFRPASLWAETACVEPRVRRERDWGLAGHGNAAFRLERRILCSRAFWRRF